MNGDWLRGKGIGRERFAGYVAEYLATLGYEVERAEVADPALTKVSAKLTRMNPSVPNSAKELRFVLYPTSGGSALVWEHPTVLIPGDETRMDRLVREIGTHLERAIATESHATAKVARPPGSHLPWQVPVNAPAASTSSA
ncbi:MAG: hypothetical protein ACREB9_05540 [Thermoplasmata archaeon]